jgi:hypothetical protein
MEVLIDCSAGWMAGRAQRFGGSPYTQAGAGRQVETTNSPLGYPNAGTGGDGGMFAARSITRESGIAALGRLQISATLPPSLQATWAGTIKEFASPLAAFARAIYPGGHRVYLVIGFS